MPVFVRFPVQSDKVKMMSETLISVFLLSFRFHVDFMIRCFKFEKSKFYFIFCFVLSYKQYTMIEEGVTPTDILSLTRMMNVFFTILNRKKQPKV
jgi:hypothetical protein